MSEVEIELRDYVLVESMFFKIFVWRESITEVAPTSCAHLDDVALFRKPAQKHFGTCLSINVLWVAELHRRLFAGIIRH